MKRRAAALAMCGASLLAACGPGNTLHHGRVVGKDYHPAYDTYTPMCVSYGKYGCTTTIPIFSHHDEEWFLRISGCMENWDNPKCHTELHRTDPFTVQNAEIGDIWDDGTGKANS